MTVTLQRPSLAKQLLTAEERIEELEAELAKTRLHQGNPLLLSRMMVAEDDADSMRRQGQEWGIERLAMEKRIADLLAAEPDKIKGLRRRLDAAGKELEETHQEYTEEVRELDELREWTGRGNHPLRAGVVARIGRSGIWTGSAGRRSYDESLIISNVGDSTALGLDFTPTEQEHRVTLEWREVEELILVLSDWMDRIGRP